MRAVRDGVRSTEGPAEAGAVRFKRPHRRWSGKGHLRSDRQMAVGETEQEST